MQGASPLASPRLNPRGTGKWGRTKHPAGGTAVLLAGLLCHCGSPAGGTMVLVAGRFFTLAVFLPPFPEGEGYPPDPPSRREGGDQGFFHARGCAPCIPGAEPVVRRKSGRKWFPAGVLFGFRGRGAGGGSPRRNKLLVSPFPPGRGAGGWGQESKPKAGFAGGKQGKPPSGHHSGKVSRQQGRHAPPPGTWFAPCISAASGSNAGMQGAKPLA